ncbi:hypothetical protein LS74_000075 [Helicobacter magdeburgensis]|uniref:Uncharacterized protein n=1 Tax=Helicobacter magdeburgensis TaxID=471858 RepID=A0A4U8T350_9HELI|nr:MULTISPECIES: hypothetical protein [Helicobacter]QOQ95869.1 hypothetical protein HW245_09800 [Helicobacter cinaedi]TLD93783.1 hypothetical protein LS74_000035 [Helicobacter magdeburgensis]TLD93788.1 hypothetical protein LS74_000075 [Helicobacter magdeburgensis]BDB64586.1 hypothetical protein T36_1042 [Helicobacter cinaedi]
MITFTKKIIQLQNEINSLKILLEKEKKHKRYFEIELKKLRTRYFNSKQSNPTIIIKEYAE